MNEDNDDVIIPISATCDEAVLHIGIGNKTGVSIEKPDVKKEKEYKTSVEHAARNVLEVHFIESNKKSQSRKKKQRGGRNKGKRVEIAKTRQKTVPHTEEVSYRSANIPPKTPATSIVVPEIILHDKAEDKTADTDQVNISVLLDTKAESAVRILPSESKFQNQNVLTNPVACSSTSSSVFEKLLGTKRPDQPRSLASACYTRSTTNVSKKFSEAASVSVPPSRLVPQSIMTHPDVVFIVSEMGPHLNTMASNTSDDSRPSRPERVTDEEYNVTDEEYVSSKIANKSESLQTIEDTVSNLIESSFQNKEPQNDESNTVQDDFITTRNTENKIAGTEAQEQATASQVISDFSTEIVHENLNESKYLDQAISQHVLSTAISCKRETSATTMTHPVDQVVSLLNYADKSDNETKTEEQLYPSHASMDTKRELNMPEMSRLDRLFGMISEDHSDAIGDDVSSAPNTEVRGGAETGFDNKVDLEPSDSSELLTTISSVTLTGSPSGNMATDDTTTPENDSSLPMPSSLPPEITDTSSEFYNNRVEAIVGDVTPPFESVLSQSGSLSCDQLSISSEATTPVASASRTSDTSNALSASASTHESSGIPTQATAGTPTQATADTMTQATAGTPTQPIAGIAAQADVSLSDIVTNLSNDTDDGNQDDDAFGIMGIFRKSDLHSPINTVSYT